MLSAVDAVTVTLHWPGAGDLQDPMTSAQWGDDQRVVRVSDIHGRLKTLVDAAKQQQGAATTATRWMVCISGQDEPDPCDTRSNAPPTNLEEDNLEILHELCALQHYKNGPVRVVGAIEYYNIT